MKSSRPADVVIVGGGWSGLLMAKEISSRTALEVVVLERGPSRTLADYAAGMDEVDYDIRHRLMQSPAEQTVTHRHSLKDPAAPIRQYGSFKPGTGTGGAGEHWGGLCDRYLPEFFLLRTQLREKYGTARLDPNLSVQDWGITYDDLENDYWRAEELLGISGKAGNLRGKLIDGGNIFEGPRQYEYPTPPLKSTYTMTLFDKASRELGYHPFPQAAATISQTYTNPDGVSRPGCFYCGYCTSFGCMIGAKAQPTNTLMPVLRKKKNFTLRNNSWVRKILHRNGQAEGVVYMDEAGAETFQPASVVVLSAWTLHNVRLLLLSRLGEPYDPKTGKGTLGKNLTHQVTTGSNVYVIHEKPVNAFMATGAIGCKIADFDGGRNVDPSDGILSGGTFGNGAPPNELPISSFGRIPPGEASRNWGAEWKNASVRLWDRFGGFTGYRGDHLSYRQNFMDLDPVYNDKWGDPLLRLTLDWTDHEHRQMAFGARISTEIAKGVAKVSGAKIVENARGPHFGRYSATSYSTTHLQGGAIMGSSSEDSVVNTALQHWKVNNLWVVGSSAFPQNSSGNPTLTIIAVAYRAADALITRYLKNPGPLA
jgi:gluconate 2-dehydrogenase alpha chain